MAKPNPIVFSDWYQGISRSRADAQGFTDLVNCDIHSEIGFITPQLALAADGTSNVPDEACIFAKTPIGTIYAFSTTSGKIWKLSLGSTWSAVTANTVITGHKGAMYYSGYIYYATATTLGRFVAETEASRNNSYGTFSDSSVYRPMEEVNLTLYIGNGNDVASVNSNGTFTNSALDCPVNCTVTALARAGVDLLVGTVIGSQVNHSSVFLWDTYSDSWTVEDTVPEVGVNCFIKDDDVVYAQCGTAGQLYYWSGNAMVRYRKLPSVTTGIAPYNTTRLSGRSLFATQGKIFSIHRADQDLPYAIVQEYTTTTGNVNSLTTYGSTLYVSTGTIVNKTGTSYATAYITTPEVAGNYDKVIAYYDSIGTGASIGISTMVDNSGTYAAKMVVTDTIKKHSYFDGGLGDVNFFQAKITLNSATTNKVKLRTIEIK